MERPVQLTDQANKNCSFLLVRHPNVMDKLRSEIACTFDNRVEVTRSDLRKMDYLQNVLKESKTLWYQPCFRESHPDFQMQLSDFILLFR